MEQINLPYASTSSASGSVILGAGSSSCSLVSGGGGTYVHEEQLQNQSSVVFDNQITPVIIPTPTQLGLDQGAMHEVYVSAIVSGGHLFLQVRNKRVLFYTLKAVGLKTADFH